jgi:hypothetical protein
MPENIVLVFVAVLSLASHYVLQKRQLSRSGGRLLQDLEILDRAIRTGVEPPLLEEIRAHVRHSIRHHTHHATKKAPDGPPAAPTAPV